MRLHRLLVPVVLLPAALGAQEVVGTRPALTRIEWPLANALVFADSNRGAQLLVAASGAAVQIDRIFGVDLEPSAVDEWANRLSAVLGATGEPPEGATYLMARLPGRTGGEVIAARERDRKKWKRDVILNFRPATGDGFSIRVTSDQATRFGTALMFAASLSAVRPLDESSPELVRLRPGDVATAPRMRTPARPHYPMVAWEQRVAGDVWVEFLVDRDGRMVPETMEVLFADHRAFVDATRTALAASIFEPGRVNGSPVPMRMRWRQLFLREYD